MNKVKLTGQLRRLLRVPILLVLFFVVVAIGIYFISVPAGMLVTVAILAYLAAELIVNHIYSRSILNEMVTFAAHYGQVQKQLVTELAVPYAITDDHGHLLWFNDAFESITGKDRRRYSKSITSLFSTITMDKFPQAGEAVEYHVSADSRDYRMQIRSVEIDPLIAQSGIIEKKTEEPAYMYAFFLFDETELKSYIRKYEDETMVCGLIYLDNYDEALENVEIVRRSLLTALIDRKISKYVQDVDGIVKKYESDKYIVVMRTRSLNEMKALKFNILEEVKNVNIGNDIAMTLSIGIGANNGSYRRNYECARIAIDLALGRGGDQVVLKDGDSITYFGGKSQAVERNTRVKARVKAHALKEFMDSKEKVVVMGHKNFDIDCFGSAIGISRAAQALNKKVYIVIDTPNTSTRPFIDSFRKKPDYDPHMFLSVSEAKEMVDRDTLLVVVDTNKPDYTECPELLHQTRTIVVLDHHRQGNASIRDAVLSYIEPYASSACEMVAEILQYFTEGIKLRNVEADAMYAGIMIDTDGFIQHTGVRTFEAAAYLRRCGADVTRVRKMFREDMDEYKARGEALRNVELYRGRFAITECPANAGESPSIVGSKVANQLLNIREVKASFVLTEDKGVIYISARAIDEVNVQIIMERMGGGGHLNMAGTQFTGKTMDEVKTLLKSVLDEMIVEGEIE